MLDPPPRSPSSPACAGASLDAGPGGVTLTAPPGPHSLVVLTGELDVLTAADVRRRLQDACACGDTRDVVVDLSAVTFMDCSNLTPLVEARRRLGPRLRLQGCSPPVRRLLRLTGLLEAFTLTEPEPEVDQRPDPVPAQARPLWAVRPGSSRAPWSPGGRDGLPA